jgi:hypothetical protein
MKKEISILAIGCCVLSTVILSGCLDTTTTHKVTISDTIISLDDVNSRGFCTMTFEHHSGIRVDGSFYGMLHDFVGKTVKMETTYHITEPEGMPQYSIISITET